MSVSRRNLWGDVVGPVLALLVVTAVQALRNTPLAIPNPPAFLQCAIVVAAFTGGIRPALISASIAWAHTAYYFWTPGAPFHYTVENFRRVMVWALTMPTIATLVGVLHGRALQRAERKIEESEDALEKERDFIAAVLDTVGALVIVLDPEGRIVRFNRASERVMGFSADEVHGKYVWDVVIAKDELLTARPLFRNIPKRETITEQEYEWTTKDGKRRRIAWSTTVLEQNGTAAFLVCTGLDVTEQRALQDQLRHSQKMEAIGQLAGGVAHDFNNLLTAIIGYTEMLMRSLEPTSPLRADLAEIHKAGDRAAELTRQLLAFSRKQVLRPKHLDLNEVVGDMDKMLRRMIGEDIELTVKLSPSLAPVRADRAQLEQVILNLAVNARDAMPNGGRLTLETANVHLDGAHAARHEGARSGQHIALVVSDSGHGMDPTTLARVFEPFFTTKEVGKGTGLGLSMAYGIVRQSDGHITVESRPGRGATFRIFLPAVEPSADSHAPPPKASRAPPGTETVLIVEDSDNVRRLMRHVLETKGYVVLEATDGAEGLRLSEAHEGPIHLLLTDVVMPGMGGRELATRLLKSRPSTRVLFASGYPRTSLPGDGVDLIPKPFTPDELERKVRETLARA